MKVLVISLIFVLIFPVMGFSEVKEEVLKNGLKLIFIRDTSSAVATFQVWYKVGSIDEPEGKSGISHLLEHMMFRGSKNYPGNVFSKIIQAQGGIDNAFTTKDYTVYFQKLSPSKLQVSIDLESDRMANLLFNSDDFELEKKIVLEERRQRYEDDPESLIIEEVIGLAFKAHPYRKPIIGWSDDIISITLDDLKRYYHEYYCPGNAFIIVAGDINFSDLKEKIREKFEKIPSCTPSRKTFYEPEQYGEKRVILKKQTHLPLVVMAYKVPAFPNKDSISIEVLSTILGEGKSSRLYRTLVTEKALAVDVSTANSPLSRDGFLFFIIASVKSPDKVDDVEKIIKEEIERIKKELPHEKEIEKAKNQVEASFLFSQDSVFGHALYIGKFEVLGTWKLIEKYKEDIMKVTAKDVQDVANRYFKAENLSVGVLLPK
ncbi:zinc protease [Thermodesulfovibrio aggregans]|uniref:Zinc protease n=1 Tax=Thermodesulfovibrio aggregans TaxID=86166 RepID=A0A0U9HZ24_9BACT|nr:pitrilysin family protein [Thermodesulfovibrio aggregans]GAQ95749.1 zinc protease [Thermodesulfovibrio aggregans]